MIPPKRFDISPPVWDAQKMRPDFSLNNIFLPDFWVLRRSGCVQIFLLNNDEVKSRYIELLINRLFSLHLWLSNDVL